MRKRNPMDKLWAFGLMQAWLLLILSGWWANKDGHADQRNYDYFSSSAWWRWMLSSQTRETYLRQRRLLHKLTLPFAISFYLLGMWGIWHSYQ